MRGRRPPAIDRHVTVAIEVIIPAEGYTDTKAELLAAIDRAVQGLHLDHSPAQTVLEPSPSVVAHFRFGTPPFEGGDPE